MNQPWRKVRALLGILLVLVFGILLGSAITWKILVSKVYDMGRHNPEELSEFITDRLNDTFNFTSPQRQKVLQAVLSYTAKRREIRKTIEPEMEALRNDFRQEVRDVLTDEQKKQFDVLLAAHSRKLLILSGPSMQDSPPPPNK